VGVTDRLYYHDSLLTKFSAAVADVDAAGLHVRLDRSAFYPASGGQPHDRGAIAGIPVEDVRDQDGEIVHVLGSPLQARPGQIVECEVDAARRLDHMQQHTGQHLLSAVLIELFEAETVSFHMGAEVSTIELSGSRLESLSLETAELRCNEVIAENRPVRVTFEDAARVTGLRRAPAREGTLRIISINGIDRSACGGTHVRSTGEIGCVLLRGTERIRGNLRLEFMCGLRAVRRARADYNALTVMARTFSASADELPKVTAAMAERLAEADKLRRKLSTDLAASRGRELHAATAPAASGLRVAVRRYSVLDDEVRAEAQAYAAAGNAALIAWCEDPPSLLAAVSPDLGRHAGNLLKPKLQAAGGRGGGSAGMAQGSLPAAALPGTIAELEAELSTAARC
jgi:alanyl-tRNA synthetase